MDLSYSSEEIAASRAKFDQHLTYLSTFYQEYEKNCRFFPGHYYSPITNVGEIKSMESKVLHYDVKEIAGIDLNVVGQLQLAREFSIYYSQLKFPETEEKDCRYYYENSFFKHTDAIILYSFLRHFKPQRVIEVGSGYSSAVMLEVNNKFFRNSIDLTFIEPHSERLNQLLREEDRASATIIEEQVQFVPIEVFKKLRKDDILFIDSSHVSKTGSDVNHLLFEILPALEKGVIIHVHDILYPFEYPLKWIYEGWNWNEAYILRAFLSNNPDYKIMFWNSFMHKYHVDSFARMSDAYKNTGASIWLRKI